MSDASLLPPNASPLERGLASISDRLQQIDVPHRQLLDGDSAPFQVLPWLAWEYSVDEWDPGWDEQQKRGAIMASIAIHRHKGTIGAVRAALAGIGIPVQVQEWFAQIPQGDPGTFHLLINASQYPVTQSNLFRVLAVLDAAKNLRSHMTLARLGVTTTAQLNSAGISCSGHDVLVGYPVNSIALLIEGVNNGEEQTASAASALYTLIHETMPAPGYW